MLLPRSSILMVESYHMQNQIGTSLLMLVASTCTQPCIVTALSS